MRRAARMAGAVALLLLTAANPVPPRDQRGRDGADCRANEVGPAVRVNVVGLKDRGGKLVLELYPATDADFLAPDKVLIAAGKPFRRVPASPSGGSTLSLCIRAPAAGDYALSLLHDRDGNGKFGFWQDGIGFSNNPRLARSKPKASAVSLRIGDGVRTIDIVMNYRQGFGMAPLKSARTS